MFNSGLLAFSGQLWLATLALTQVTSPASSCFPVTSTFRHIDLGINSDLVASSSFKSSMDAKYNTPATPTPVAIYTASTVIGTRTLRATGYYDYNPLTSEGFEIYTSIIETTSCSALTTPTLPPSPTGSICSPHGDHWHCEPSPTPSQSDTPPDTSAPAETCSPHGDHWHCPPGVPEPTTPPPQETTPGETSAVGTCSPHGDHWHCPPGVPEPTTPPPQETTVPPQETCSPHGDHWHCPPGVPEPTTPPPQDTTVPPQETCSPHGDHWHCPPGVPEPTSPPPNPTTLVTSSRPDTTAPAVVVTAAAEKGRGLSIAALFSILAFAAILLV
ncbi:hypothetical protein SAPIO_CDS6505 [Scedosporium apiospermum]|uniref:Uncharacterized protein n=1 Tax=Pseudallescheria apiosperma TaxID=563466 RepID=A0A084G3N0_PSEDA|nr:uncharacterized protein SAPIO_CDS6505 [Scedosporium apiospermum]KEZ41942.1 hypothetical protein SAPIO_CDS6505 [Scedosporium apiospermum]